MIPLVLISAVVLGLAFLVYASYNVSSNVYVNAFCRAKTTRKVVALTFDDGPHGENTEAVLDLLSAKKIPAAFFCIGSKAETQPDVVRRMVRDGHLVGNHSYSHSAKFPVFDVDKMVADIAKCNEVLEKITEEKVLFFRPPFGVTNPLLKKALKSFEFDVVGWSVRSYDARAGETVESVVERIIKRIEPGSVILLHDRLDDSEEILRRVLQWLADNEYEVERADRLLGLPSVED